MRKHIGRTNSNRCHRREHIASFIRAASIVITTARIGVSQTMTFDGSFLSSSLNIADLFDICVGLAAHENANLLNGHIANRHWK